MDYEPYVRLANAIVHCAAMDYKKALKRLRRFPDNAEALAVKQEVEKFFCSGWFELLTNLDGEELLKQIRYNERMMKS